MRIYTLAGEQLVELCERSELAAGRHSMVWSGEAGDGRVVSPGIYVARISVDADWESAEDATVDRLVYVAY